MRTSMMFLALLLGGGVACAQTPQPSANQVAISEVQTETSYSSAATAPQVVAEMPLEIHWYRNSAEKKADFLQTYWLARRQIEVLSKGHEKGSWAVSLDADETVLDNSQFQVEMVQKGQRFNIDIWNEWCRREEATAQPGAVEFTKYVKELGGRVIIVTNRGVEVQAETERNLTQIGVPYDLVLCKDETGDKVPRYQSIVEGTASEDLPPLNILMWVGDNIEDFPHMEQSLRHEDAEEFDDFGTRFIVLPNPMYGSWLGNEKN